MQARFCTVRLPQRTLAAIPASSLRVHPVYRHTSCLTRSFMQAAPQQAADSSTGSQQLVSLLTDAHCHPQLDPANMQAVLQLHSNKLAAMSVSYDVDWDIMLQLHKLAGVYSGCMAGAGGWVSGFAPSSLVPQKQSVSSSSNCLFVETRLHVLSVQYVVTHCALASAGHLVTQQLQCRCTTCLLWATCLCGQPPAVQPPSVRSNMC